MKLRSRELRSAGPTSLTESRRRPACGNGGAAQLRASAPQGAAEQQEPAVNRSKLLDGFTITTPAGFDLASAVCSYGWILLCPNRWTPGGAGSAGRQVGTFSRPLRTCCDSVTHATIAQAGNGSLTVRLHPSVRQADVEVVRKQVIRMLRLSRSDEEAVRDFQAKHTAAAQCGFGRLLRSPSVWEDIVKCILLCNCGWGRTLQMNERLCQKFGGGAFPTPRQLASVDAGQLQASCGVGYRAKSIVQLAQQVVAGELDLEALEDAALSDDELLALLGRLPGLGPFSANNMLQLLGRYAVIACDSETIRHLKKHHGVTSAASPKQAQLEAAKIYGKYEPFQFLAYWLELWNDYEQLCGPIAALPPSLYHSFTGSNMRKMRNPGASDEQPSSKIRRRK